MSEQRVAVASQKETVPLGRGGVPPLTVAVRVMTVAEGTVPFCATDPEAELTVRAVVVALEAAKAEGMHARLRTLAKAKTLRDRGAGKTAAFTLELCGEEDMIGWIPWCVVLILQGMLRDAGLVVE